ncbi:hypothetical protein BVC80_1775g15 [Macleaya cordata]|uniref:DUF7734 domain-containing protein n=1 Tax=Macleaya cordata TaxID=56857 RepID=A0A200QNX9_MACCD|nr:hypothetical protein BVC80_1775g15 [Macleaya cordata]
MLKQLHGGVWANLSLPSLPCSSSSLPISSINTTTTIVFSISFDINKAYSDNKLINRRGKRCVCCCLVRRRVRYEDEEKDDDDDEQYGYNSEIGMLESYSESARNEALLVRAMVDGQEEEVLIFKGFSSCLSYRTLPDPSRSILPARAVITSIDRIKGPFDPSNIEYIEKGLTWETFWTRFQSPTKPF